MTGQAGSVVPHVPPKSALESEGIQAAEGIQARTRFPEAERRGHLVHGSKSGEGSSAGPSDAFPRARVAADAVPRGTAQVQMNGRASTAVTVLNLSKNLIGAAMLCLPYTFFEGLPLVGAAWFVFMGALFALSFWVTGVLAGHLGARSYGELWSVVVGPETAWVADLGLALNTFLACILYYTI